MATCEMILAALPLARLGAALPLRAVLPTLCEGCFTDPLRSRDRRVCDRTTAGHANHCGPSTAHRLGSDTCAHLDSLARAHGGRPQNRRTESVVQGFGRGRAGPRCVTD